MVGNAGKAVMPALCGTTTAGWPQRDLGAFLPHWHHSGLPGVSSRCHAPLPWGSAAPSAPARVCCGSPPSRGHYLCCFAEHFTLLFPCKPPLSFSLFFLSGLRGHSSPSDFVVSWGLLVFWKPDRCISGCSVGTRALFNLN